MSKFVLLLFAVGAKSWEYQEEPDSAEPEEPKMAKTSALFLPLSSSSAHPKARFYVLKNY